LEKVREYLANVAPGGGRMELEKIEATVPDWLNQYWVKEDALET
jgi:hypothetical protein